MYIQSALPRLPRSRAHALPTLPITADEEKELLQLRTTDRKRKIRTAESAKPADAKPYNQIKSISKTIDLMHTTTVLQYYRCPGISGNKDRAKMQRLSVRIPALTLFMVLCTAVQLDGRPHSGLRVSPGGFGMLDLRVREREKRLEVGGEHVCFAVVVEEGMMRLRGGGMLDGYGGNDVVEGDDIKEENVIEGQDQDTGKVGVDELLKDMEVERAKYPDIDPDEGTRFGGEEDGWDGEVDYAKFSMTKPVFGEGISLNAEYSGISTCITNLPNLMKTFVIVGVAQDQHQIRFVSYSMLAGLLNLIVLDFVAD